MRTAIALTIATLAIAGCSSSGTQSAASTSASSSTNAEAGAYLSASPVTDAPTPATEEAAQARMDELSAEIDKIKSEIESGDASEERQAWLSDRVDAINAEIDTIIAAYGGGDPTEGATEDEAAPEGTPDADYTSTCDYILDPYKFVATAYITNTGGVPFEAKVTATWKQADGNHVRKSKMVDVAADADEQEVYLTTKATSGQIDLIQALPTEKQCSIKVKVAG